MRVLVVLASCMAVACGGGQAQQVAEPAPPRPEVAAPPPSGEKPAAATPPVAPGPPESDEISITSTSPEAIDHLRQGRALLDNQRIAESTPHFKKAVELDPGFAMATLYLGLVTPGSAGLKLITHAVELAQAAPEPERDYIAAQAAVTDNDLEKVRALLRKATQAKPKDARAQRQLAQLAITDESWDEATSALKRMVEADPKDAPAWNLLAYALDAQGRADEAIAAARKQVELLPEEPNPYDTLGEILLDAGRLDEASQAFAKAVEKSPQFVGAMTGAGLVLAFKGDWSGAHALFRKAAAGAPRPTEAIGADYLTAWALAAQGKTADVLKTYDAIAKKAQDEKLDLPLAFAAANRVFMLALIGKPRDTLREIALAEAPAKLANLAPVPLHNYRVILDEARLLAAWKLKKPADAAKAYATLEAEIKTMPVQRFDRTILDFGQGLVAWTQGDAKAAVAAMKRCSQFDYPCRFLLVQAQRAAGDKAGAAEALARLKAAPRRDGSFLYFWATMK